jgi:hypothetical protein
MCAGVEAAASKWLVYTEMACMYYVLMNVCLSAWAWQQHAPWKRCTGVDAAASEWLV